MPRESPPLFIHLRTHSAYSLAEGALRIKQMAAMARDFAMPALAITDTGNLFGALEFSEALRDKGVQPIIGLSLTVDFGGEAQGHQRKYPTLGLLAQTESGYRNLIKLSSHAYLDSADSASPHVPLDVLLQHCEGVICLTGGPLGPINRALVEQQSSRALRDFQTLHQCFGDRLYVELQRHGRREEREAEPRLIRLAYEGEVPLVATNECYFATREDYDAHDALLCIADGAVLAAEERRRVTPEHYFKSPAEMAELFADIPEAIASTVEIARRCAFIVKPRKPILPRFSQGDEAQELRSRSHEGLTARLAARGLVPPHTEEDYRKRLDFELDVISGMKFPGYFLIVADFIAFARASGIPVGPGRGSGAGSLVAYALTITDLDPFRFGLLFERFLNPDRVSMPDFDIDFCQDRRDEVIRYVCDKYGADRVAQIITFGKLQARAVCRDVGRVLQMPYGQVDRLCKLIPMNPANPVTLSQAIEGEPRLQNERDNDPAVRTMLEIGLKLEGLYRHASTHAAGIVIADRPLEELVPLYRDPRSAIAATQFSMKWVELAGLVKFDFLGLKTLTVIDKAVKLIRQRQPDFDIDKIPFDDEATYRMLGHGDTVGVFQLEGSGMRDVVRKMRADRIEDIIATVALFRPGPMENIPRYIACKKGDEAPDYLHPLLEPILKETYGIMVYQEQVMQIAQTLSGYSLGEADLLRRAMGKKIKSEMDAQKERFVSGAVARGVPHERADFIFELVAKFAGYGFNKSHAAGYAVVAYQTAYLKANYPVAFFAASMSLDMGNTDKLQLFRNEALRMGLRILPPSINRSGVDFGVKDEAIVYSLAALRHVGQGAVEHLCEVRNTGGPFASLGDFARRIDGRIFNKRALESLAKAGAFDELEPDRARVLVGVDALLAASSYANSEADAGQSNLFGESTTVELRLPQAEPWTPMQRLAEEFDSIGFYLSGHPLDDYAKALTRLNVETWTSFRDKVLARGVSVGKIAGTVMHRQERRSRQGNKFAFVGFSDSSGQFEAICFSDTLAQTRDLLEPGKAVIVQVEADVDGEDIKLRIQSVEALEQAAAASSMGLKVFLKDTAPLDSLAKRLVNGGKSPIQVVLLLEQGREVAVLLGNAFTVTPQIKGAIKAIPGVVEVQDF
jgi:DNA polymerase-3 subunit alpha